MPPSHCSTTPTERKAAAEEFLKDVAIIRKTFGGLIDKSFFDNAEAELRKYGNGVYGDCVPPLLLLGKVLPGPTPSEKKAKAEEMLKDIAELRKTFGGVGKKYFDELEADARQFSVDLRGSQPVGFASVSILKYATERYQAVKALLPARPFETKTN